MKALTAALLLALVAASSGEKAGVVGAVSGRNCVNLIHDSTSLHCQQTPPTAPPHHQPCSRPSMAQLVQLQQRRVRLGQRAWEPDGGPDPPVCGLHVSGAHSLTSRACQPWAKPCLAAGMSVLAHARQKLQWKNDRPPGC